MKRIVPGILLAALFLFAFHTARADDLVGRWAGTLSAGEYRVSVSARFTENGYKISAGGIVSSSGSYSLSGKRITLSPSSPPGFSTTTMSISLKGDRLTIKGTVAGRRGTLKLERKGGSSQDDPAEDPQETPAPTSSLGPEDQAALERLAGRWTGDWQGRRLTLIVYRDGWAALLVGEDGDLSPLIYGTVSFEEGLLVIRQAAGGDAEEPLTLGDLPAEGRPEAPLALALPYEIDSESGLMYAGEEELVLSPQPGAQGAQDYLTHPERPDWKEEE